jgi:hypothetical protein
MNCHAPRPPAPPVPPPSFPLRDLFSRCPVCRGTTTMDHFYINSVWSLGSVCCTCDSKWDLKGNPVHRGAVVILPHVDPVRLPCANFEGCTGRRPRVGRPPGSFDKAPRKNSRHILPM